MPNFTDVIWPPLQIPQPTPYVQNWQAPEPQPNATTYINPTVTEDERRAFFNITPPLQIPPVKIYPPVP